jgi:hypothetical protein
MDDGETFKNIVASSDRLKARWEAVSTKMIADGREAFGGVNLSLEELIQLPSTRIAVLSEDGLSDGWLNEAKTLDRVQAHLKQVQLKADLENGSEFAHAELRQLSPASRITRARELSLETNAMGGAERTAESEAVLLRRCLSLSPVARLSFARQHGLI